MNFNLSHEFLEGLRSAIDQEDQPNVQNFIKELHPADLAEVINELSRQESVYLFKNLKIEIASGVLIELDKSIRDSLLENLQPAEIADLLDGLSSDDTTDIVNELPEEIRTEVIRFIEDKQQAKDVTELLHYEEDTAGGLMAKELIKARHNWTVEQCIQEIKSQYGNVEKIYWVYVVDEFDKLLGLLSLEKLIVSDNQNKLISICEKNFVFVNAFVKQEEVAELMKKYDVVAMPVLSNTGKLLGRITIDDIVDVIIEEETEEVHKMGGLQALDDSYKSSSVFEMIKKRAGWLAVLFVGESFTATAMSFFEDTIAKAVILALFVPLIISSGGNTGSQASTLIIRSMALGEISVHEWWKIFNKELRIGFILGIILGLIGFLRIAVWSTFTDIYGPHWLLIGLVVGISLIGVVIWGNLMGSLFPIFLKKLGMDPATVSAPFVATFVDVTGLLIYFTFASLLLKGILL